MKCRISVQDAEERRFAEIVTALARGFFPGRRLRIKQDESKPPRLIVYITVENDLTNHA